MATSHKPDTAEFIKFDRGKDVRARVEIDCLAATRRDGGEASELVKCRGITPDRPAGGGEQWFVVRRPGDRPDSQTRSPGDTNDRTTRRLDDEETKRRKPKRQRQP
ncbi:hypothetical protein JCM24511_09306 [Saitozyma sp. JCM 24511]|nr:hypothetical protein JCM24511_09306 [Saitozyma sp. JCM 24511]